MTTTIECMDCGESAPSGRLSCPTCGALLATLSRSSGPIPAVTGEPVGSESAEAVRDVEPLFPDDAPPAPWPPLPEPKTEPTPAPVLVGRTYGRTPSSLAAETPAAPPPGAYRPPTLALATASSRASDWPSSVTAAGVADATVTQTMAGGPTSDGMLGTLTLEPARILEIAGWFVVVGSAMAILGFVLPWSVVVIGARGNGGYLDDWGLAGSSHLVVLAGLLVVLALGVVRTPVPAWLKTGVLGLGLGAMLFGLIWPYLIGPLGADIGALMTAIGAMALVIGGAAASWASRHVEAEPPV
jgi:hypothetical protein